MNKRIGMYSSIVTLIGVVGFALSMFIGSDYGSYLFSLFISWGFVPMICSFSSVACKENNSAGYAAIAFSAMYAVVVGLVYFAQLTTIRLTELNEQVLAILDYRNLGSLFFNYDLFGYAFMAIATFFIALTIEVNNKKDKWLKLLLLIHGIFAVSCIAMPIMGVFSSNMKNGNIIGVLVLEIWCVYFTPICILSYQYFKK
jgi:ABC-type Co2+ transport system permease subunit